MKEECSVSWFLGFKLHIITNDCGEIINFMLTPANVHNANPLKMKGFINKLHGKLFRDIKDIYLKIFFNHFLKTEFIL
uniref:transposase n=1 Tax=Flavobacterium oreochromis TaxID=2906078 RepID=UPI003744768A